METLDAAEVRVLGSLLEKDLATPEYYPMSLNAVVLACNQKNNRNPVVSYGEDTVERALESLRRKRLAAVITGAGMRVPKYRHLIGEELNLGRRELAVLAVLLLRGPQTIGELRDRTERMHAFTDASEVESVLERLMGWGEQPLAVRLPRAPGTKERDTRTCSRANQRPQLQPPRRRSPSRGLRRAWTGWPRSMPRWAACARK